MAIVFENWRMARRPGRPRSSERLRAESCVAIDVRELPPVIVSATPDRVPQFLVKAVPDEWTPHEVTLSWPDGTRLDVTVFTITTRPNYGGERRWFRCGRCSRRCSKLFTPDCLDPSFACRHCWRLVYNSQYDRSEDFRLIRRVFIHPKSRTASARSQRSKRYLRKLLGSAQSS